MAETDTQTPEAKPLGMADVKRLYDAYHVPSTVATIEHLLGPDGTVSPEKFDSLAEHVRRQAAGLYPTLAPQIMAGIPTADLLEPYRQIGKQIMGDDFEPNFQTDPTDRAALSGGFDPQTQRPAPMTLEAWQQHVKSNPHYGYMDTPQGQAERRSVLAKIHAGLSGEQ